MSLAIDGLQPHFVPGMVGISGRANGAPLADLLLQRGRVGFHLDFDSVTQSVRIDFGDATLIANSIASDSSRFAAAAFQSMRGASADFETADGVSWALVRTYYAAFYAGHAIARILGESYSHFDRSHCQRINEIASAVGSSDVFRMSAGLYKCAVNTRATGIECTQIRGGAGGTHEMFWSGFSQLLRRIGDGLLQGPMAATEAQAVFAKLVDYQTAVRTDGAGMDSWLSVVRNEIQYRHAYGAWRPCAIKKQERDLLGRVASQWSRDPMDVDIAVANAPPLRRYVGVCSFVVALCLALFVRIAERSDRRSRSFASIGPLSVARSAS